MHIIAYGIICHQNWRIGPSLEVEGVSYSLKVKWILLINETILVNIVEFIHRTMHGQLLFSSIDEEV